jgi:hypothetical protein
MRLDDNQLKQLAQRAKSGQMTSEDCRLLQALIKSHTKLVNLLKDPDTSRQDLYEYLPSDENDTPTEGVAGDRSDSLPEAREE